MLQRMTHWPDRNRAFFTIGVSAAALSGAYISQYGFGLHPCDMCYWQRIPYFALIVLGLIGWAMQGKPAARVLFWLCVFVFWAGALLAGFHAGVEWKLWEGPSACSGGITATMTAEEIRAQLFAAKAVSCTEPAFRFLGLSMAGWNMLYSWVCGDILLISLIKRFQKA